MFERVVSLRRHQGFMRYLKNTSWLFGEKLLRIFAGLFIGIWIARYLGPEQFGLFSYATSFVGLFAAFAALGLDGIVVRELVRDETRRDLLIGTAFWLRFFSAVVVMIMIAVAVQFTDNDPFSSTLIFIIASSVFFQTLNVIDFYFQSKVLSRYVVYSNVLSLLVTSIIKIALILYEAPLIAFAWVVLFDSLILAGGYVYFYFHKELSIRQWRFDPKIAKELLISGLPLMLSGVFVAIYMKIDQVMIKEMLDNDAVGQYAAATRISEAWYFMPMIISGSLFPAIINAKKESTDLYNIRLQRLYDFMVYMGLLVAVPVAFMGPLIINVLYGEQYASAGDVLVVHIWAGIFIGLLVASGKWIINEELNRHALYRNIAGAVVNIFLNILLIREYGIVGAAYATLVSYFIAGFGYDLFNAKLRSNFYLKVDALTFRSTRVYIYDHIRKKV